MFENRPVIPGKVNVYLFGETATDPNDEGKEDGFVHWNACFVERDDIMFFDPALSMFDKDHIRILLDDHSGIDIHREYDFASRSIISQLIKETTGKDYNTCMTLSMERPQFVISYKRDDKDLFCQTWVLCFLDFYCHNRVNEFCRFKFNKFRTSIVKHWIYCRLERMYDIEKNDDWLLLDNDEELEFFYYPYIITDDGIFVSTSSLMNDLVLQSYKDTDNCPDFLIEYMDAMAGMFVPKEPPKICKRKDDLDVSILDVDMDIQKQMTVDKDVGLSSLLTHETLMDVDE